MWVGAAIYDRRVGMSRTTGQITHITAADIDAERDYLLHCLQETGLAESYVVARFHTILQGRNGGGDPWHTDGSLDVGVIPRQVAVVSAAGSTGALGTLACASAWCKHRYMSPSHNGTLVHSVEPLALRNRQSPRLATFFNSRSNLRQSAMLPCASRGAFRSQRRSGIR